MRSPSLPHFRAVRLENADKRRRHAEERKAAIRRVNMELDEVDEIVSPVPPFSGLHVVTLPTTSPF